MDLVICNEKPGGGESVKNVLDKIPELNIVRGLSSVSEILQAVENCHFDLCVIGARSLDWWKGLQPELKHVKSRLGKQVAMAHILTAEFLVKAYDLGMCDVLYSSLSHSDLVLRCLEVLNGQRNISNVSSKMELSQFMPVDSAFRFLKDDCDVEIMMLLLEGCTNEEISERVFVALQTVRNRISRLIRDAGVQNRTQLALLMVR